MVIRTALWGRLALLSVALVCLAVLTAPVPTATVPTAPVLTAPLAPLGLGTDAPAGRAEAGPGCELVVLAAADDPFISLAEEIAAAEGAPLVHALPEALTCRPRTLIWVAARSSLSDEAMVAFGRAMQAEGAGTAAGLITGTGLSDARALWERRTAVRGERCFAVNAPNPAAHVEGEIVAAPAAAAFPAAAAGAPARRPLTRAGFLETLAVADYLSFTGHGGSSYLRLDESTRFESREVPALDGTVIGTGSCQTFRPWESGSIALRFAEQGAAAYAGFVYSPNEGYLIGGFDGLPFRYTWPDFTIGHVVAVQNRGTLQGFARFPYLVLLGDPRIALQNAPHYHVVADRQAGAWRTVTLADVPAGTIPIRVAGGAAYGYVAVPGLTAAADGDPFFNSRLQSVNVRGDKLLLVDQGGGTLTLRLRTRAPWFWVPLDLVLDSLDHTLLFVPQSEGDLVMLGFAVVPVLWVAVQAVRGRLDRRRVRIAPVVGLGAAVLHGLYAAVRLDDVTVTSKAVVFSPLGVLATFVLTTCGALLYLHARRRVGRGVALLVIAAPSWVPLVFTLIGIEAINRLTFIPRHGIAVYNVRLALLPAATLVVTLVGAGGVLGWLRSRAASLHSGRQSREDVCDETGG